MKKNRVLIILALVFVLAALGACGNTGDKKSDKAEGEDKKSEEKKEETNKDEKKAEEKKQLKEGTTVGDLAIDFELKRFGTNETFKLSDYRGKNPVIVKFFASWCGPCHKEMPALNSLYEEYKDDGLIVLAVNLGSNDNERDVAKLIDDYVLSFPVLQDWDSKTAYTYLVRSIPVNVFIDKEGVIQAYRNGLQSKDEYESGLKLIMDTEK